MIEYLNAIFLVLLVLLITVVSFLNNGVLNFENLKDLIGSWKDILDFLGNIPRWIQFYNNLTDNKQKLAERKIRLRNKQTDVRKHVENKEFQTGRRRKREVDHWLSSTEIKCNEVETLQQDMRRLGTNYFWKFIYLAWLGNIVEKKIQEVDDLYSSGEFREVLWPFRERLDLLTTQLVGTAGRENIRRILGWLNNGVTKIGVYGIKGIGKTEVMKHVHNQLSQDDLHVYMIQVGENQELYELQVAIAREIGIDLQEDDEPKRAALLHRALKQRNFVLILDGLTKNLSEDKVGVPLDRARGKMIITSRSRDVCRRIGCQNNMIAMDPLLDDEGLLLFRKKVELELDFWSEKEDLAKRIVAECRGVPRKIVETAEDLRGIPETSVWEETLNKMLLANA